MNALLEHHNGKPSWILAAWELQAITGFLTSFLTTPVVKRLAPKGNGQAVLILPGFMQVDASTASLQVFLRSLGYRVFVSELGLNRGYSDGLGLMLGRRLRTVHDEVQGKIAIIGQSLGGTYAREMARLHPDWVSMVVSLGSPFTGNLQATNVSWLYNIVSARKIKDLPRGLVLRMKSPMPVPCTSIFSPTDGVVSNQTSMQSPAPLAENVKVFGTHCGMAWNPLVLWVIADRLTQPDGEWKPFCWPTISELSERVSSAA